MVWQCLICLIWVMSSMPGQWQPGRELRDAALFEPRWVQFLFKYLPAWATSSKKSASNTSKSLGILVSLLLWFLLPTPITLQDTVANQKPKRKYFQWWDHSSKTLRSMLDAVDGWEGIKVNMSWRKCCSTAVPRVEISLVPSSLQSLSLVESRLCLPFTLFNMKM